MNPISGKQSHQNNGSELPINAPVPCHKEPNSSDYGKSNVDCLLVVNTGIKKLSFQPTKPFAPITNE